MVYQGRDGDCLFELMIRHCQEVRPSIENALGVRQLVMDECERDPNQLIGVRSLQDLMLETHDVDIGNVQAFRKFKSNYLNPHSEKGVYAGEVELLLFASMAGVDIVTVADHKRAHALVATGVFPGFNCNKHTPKGVIFIKYGNPTDHISQRISMNLSTFGSYFSISSHFGELKLHADLTSLDPNSMSVFQVLPIIVDGETLDKIQGYDQQPSSNMYFANLQAFMNLDAADQQESVRPLTSVKSVIEEEAKCEAAVLRDSLVRESVYKKAKCVVQSDESKQAARKAKWSQEAWERELSSDEEVELTIRQEVWLIDVATAQRVSLVGGAFHAFKELVETLRNDRVDELRGNGKGHRLCYFRDLDVRSNLFAGWKQLAAMSKKKRTVVKRGDRRLVTHLFEGWRNHARTSAQERRMLTEVLESWIGYHRIQHMQLLRIRKSKHRKTMKNVFFTWIEQTVEREVNAAHTH